MSDERVFKKYFFFVYCHLVQEVFLKVMFEFYFIVLTILCEVLLMHLYIYTNKIWSII